jgi:hypothetical protein
MESQLDPRALHSAIRAYRPKNKFAHLGKPCNITDLDEAVHAGRVAQRLIGQSFLTRLRLPGGWSSHVKTRQRVEALYNWIKECAAREKWELRALLETEEP